MSKLGIDANRRLLQIMIITGRGYDGEERSLGVLRAGLRFQAQGVQ